MTHRFLRTWGVILLAILCISTAAAQTACSVSYAITSQWPGGFGAALTIKNTGTTSLSSWTLAWSFANGQTITQLWNGNATQSGSNVAVTNVGYNGSIPAGGSLTGLGFNGTWNNSTNSVPTSFTLNGVTCGGSGGGTGGSFTLAPSASTLSVTVGGTGSDTIAVTDVSGFTGAVSLAVSGLPSGVTAAFSTSPATTSSVMTFTASSSATPGTSVVTITGTSGTLTASTTIALTIAAKSSGSFVLAPSSTSLSLTDGKSGADTITIVDTGSFSGSVNLSISGLPNGVSASFGTNPAISSSALTLTASSTAAAGTSTLTITGTSGSTTASAQIALTVNAANSGSFTLTPASNTVTVSPNAGATDTITVNDISGFTGAVTFNASGVPSGVTASFTPSSTTGSTVLSFLASSSAQAGTSTITIQGTFAGGASQSLSATTTISLVVSSKAALQIAWVSPAAGTVGSSVTIMPGVGASFGASQGSSEILFGSTPATVTTWTVNSIAVQVPDVPVGMNDVTAVVNGVTSNAVPFTVTAAVPSPQVYTGNSTWFSGLGGPYGGCGVPQANVDSQNFVALNVQNDPGNYSLELSRPISSQYASDIGLWNNGLNCGRWVHVTIGAICNGVNDGEQSEPFCRNGLGWIDDQFTGAELDLVVADSCQDGNAWCRDDPYHLDQAQGALNNYILNGQPVGDMYPNNWNNRQISWYFEPAPNYTGDINIGFLNGANAYWSAISVTHLANGIHGVDYYSNGAWTAATMDADLGDDYIILPTSAGGTQYQIRVYDVTGTLINNGRIYLFSYPSSCGTSCTPALTPVTYTITAPSTSGTTN